MMTNDEKQIRELLNQFVYMWGSGRTEGLTGIVTEDCVYDFSMFDAGIGREEFAAKLAERTHPADYTRFEIYNYVCAANETEAQQSSIVAGLFSDEKEQKSFYFNFFMMCSLKKTEDGWKYTAMRGELGSGSDIHARLRNDGVHVDRTGGDDSFIANWNNIDLTIGWYENSRPPRIVPEFDAPWYAIENRIADQTDEEEITELVSKYCYALDHDILRLYDDVFSEECNAVYSGTRLYNKRTCTEMLKFERAGMLGRGHILYPEWIKVNNDQAEGRFYRAGYLPPELCLGDAAGKNWVCARYDLRFVKEKGMWKIYRLNYLDGRLERPLPDSITKYEFRGNQKI